MTASVVIGGDVAVDRIETAGSVVDIVSAVDPWLRTTHSSSFVGPDRSCSEDGSSVRGEHHLCRKNTISSSSAAE